MTGPARKFSRVFLDKADATEYVSSAYGGLRLGKN
jgi:hypothetical protein